MPRFTDPLPPASGFVEGKRPDILDPTRAATCYPRDQQAAAAADAARRERFGSVQNRPELTRPQTVAMLSHDWAVPRQLVQRILDVETENLLLRADLASVYDRLNRLEAK